ncbi:MAG: alpha/beta hydrolase [Desulfobacter sp.]|nr:alpha/beta hydrolase [Desulfobacter sp.]
MQVHLRDEGRKENLVPIVLLHGTSASLHTWEGWVQALKKEHRVIRFDMPAFGLTGPSPENQYTIQDYASVVIAVLDRLRINTCVLAGNSLGGYAAWVTALLYPDRIQRLVLVDASGYPYKSNSVPLGFIIARTPVLNRLAKNLLPRKLVETSLKNVYANPLLVTQDLVDRYFDLTTRAGNRQALAQRFSQTQPGSLAGRIPELKQPTLILWGVQDRLIPIAMGERFHREIADSKFISFDHLGHVPQEEDPQATVAALKQFLAETKVFNAQK